MVDSVPIYIQEKIKAEAIIGDLKRRSEAIRREREECKQYVIPDIYNDFNGLSEPGTEFDFYKHDKNWSNRMILGDSLLVMNSLAEKEALTGQVQCIYMDPPYGIRFNSNWQPSTKSREVKDGQADNLTREPEMIRAFRDTWKDGIHSYLPYLRERRGDAPHCLSGTAVDRWAVAADHFLEDTRFAALGRHGQTARRRFRNAAPGRSAAPPRLCHRPGRTPRL
jgi:hypothetical protein